MTQNYLKVRNYIPVLTTKVKYPLSSTFYPRSEMSKFRTKNA